MSLKSKVPFDLWDSSTQRVDGYSKQAREANNLISETRTKISIFIMIVWIG
ncbi:hypothetical protein [Salegentibacter sp. 24]|uniref:hypothetical protein n=1 Tax=Salegentibacter sp. 24 TaxID=2183986 RepID=UPI00397E76DB